MERMGNGKWSGIRAALLASSMVLGACGADGAQGPAGAPGAKGDRGEPGAMGATGTMGAQGPTGPLGPTGATGPAGTPASRPARLLDDRVCGWIQTNRDRLNQLISEKGIASASFDPRKRPVAVFDWDNTVIKNDIGDGTLFWMIRNDKILQPSNRDWANTSAALTAAAVTELNAACGALSAPGTPVPTASSTTCATAIARIYDSGQTSGGQGAWSPVTTTNNPPYTWVAQLLSGHSPSEARAFAEAALEWNLSQPVGNRQAVGSLLMNGFIRVYEPIEDLIRALDENGFDIWVVSASPQSFVEAAAALVGIDPDRVIGIRNVLVNGKITKDIQGCGTVDDMQNRLITFDEGKRCWINKVIYNEPSVSQMARNADPTKRPVFVAGDSDTDIAMMKDATDVKLAINRGKTQIMCNAYTNRGDSWLVQPMFIEPRSQRATPYPCTTTNIPGTMMRIVDETGAPFTMDVMDTAYQLPACN